MVIMIMLISDEIVTYKTVQNNQANFSIFNGNICKLQHILEDFVQVAQSCKRA